MTGIAAAARPHNRALSNLAAAGRVVAQAGQGRSKKTGRGQVQQGFLFIYKDADDGITLGDKVEFEDWRWVSMTDLVLHVVEFKQRVYRDLEEDFSTELKKLQS